MAFKTIGNEKKLRAHKIRAMKRSDNIYNISSILD